MEKNNRSLNIRNGVLGDLPAIVDIYNSAIPGRKSVADTVPITVESRVKWFHEHKQTNHPLWVLDLRGTIAAWISLQSYSPEPAFRKTAEVSVYVANEYQRQGYGTALLKRLLEKCPELGVSVVMGVMFANNDATIKMNTELGFEHWGRLRRVAEIEGEVRDLIIMGINIVTASKRV